MQITSTSTATAWTPDLRWTYVGLVPSQGRQLNVVGSAAGDRVIGEVGGYAAFADARSAAGLLSEGSRPAVAIFAVDHRFYLKDLQVLDHEGLHPRPFSLTSLTGPVPTTITHDAVTSIVDGDLVVGRRA